MAKTKQENSAASVAAFKPKKKKEIAKPKKVLREGLQQQKGVYESEDWRFTEEQNAIGPNRWTATNGSPVFPKLFGESLSLIFSRIENLKSENGDRLRTFIENQRSDYDAGELPFEWQKEKTALESSGWTFDYDAEKSEWAGTHAHHLGVTGVNDFSRLLGIVQKNMRGRSGAEVEATENLSAAALEPVESVWQKLPRIQQFQIGEFAQAHEVSYLYPTENGTVEIEFEDKKKNVLTSVFFDKLGQKYSKRRPEFGANVFESGCTIENFYQYCSDFAAERETEIRVADTASLPIVELPVDEITLSEFSPQRHRRRRFKPEDLAELAESIKNQGLINPITVRRRDWEPHLTEFGRYGAMLHAGRPDWVLQHVGKETETEAQAWCDANRYEIVAGERRFEATKLAGLKTILCVARDLTDEQALEIQLQENLQRVDVNPLDEAFSYKFLMETQKMSVADLMVKFGKSEKYIALRLKLNNLIPEVLDVIAAGQLPLAHAVEISKFDQIQQPEVLKCCFDTSWSPQGYLPDYDKPLHLKSVLKNIASKVLHKLKDAPFSIKDKRLRADGLICPNCPERTGANNPMSLFEEYREDGADRCLNAACYQTKTNRYLSIKRDEATKKVKKELNCADDYQIRVLSYHSRNKSMLKAIFGEGVLSDGEYKNVYSPPCQSAQPAVYLDPGTHLFGNVVQICLDKNCKKHGGNISTASVPGEKTDKEKEEFYKRKQEIFDIKVGEPVRKKVLSEAAKTFDWKNWVFDDEKWRLRLVERIWSRIDDNARQVITEALGREKHSIRESELKTFSADELSRILFLSIIANEGEMLWGSWRDQKGIVAVAEEFGVDYALLDAKERAEAAPKKFKDAATEHLGKVERGEKIARPIFYKLEK